MRESVIETPQQAASQGAKAMTATATYKDIWAGDIEVQVQAFKTKRRGVSVTRYRWSVSGVWASPLVSVEQAVRHAKAHRSFSNIVTA